MVLQHQTKFDNIQWNLTKCNKIWWYQAIVNDNFVLANFEISCFAFAKFKILQRDFELFGISEILDLRSEKDKKVNITVTYTLY
jgi:hypothetical protein